MSEIKNRYVVI